MVIMVEVARALIIYLIFSGRYIHPDFGRNSIHFVQENIEFGALTLCWPRKTPFALILNPHSS